MYEKLHEKIYALQVIVDGCLSVLVSPEELLELFDFKAKQVLLKPQATNQWHFNILSQSTFVRDAYSGSLEYLRARATFMRQFEPSSKETKRPYRFNLGGRIIEFYNPSDRYLYDRGTESQLEADVADGFLNGSGIFGSWREKDKQKQDNISKKNKRQNKGDECQLGFLDLDASDAVLTPRGDPNSGKGLDASVGYGLVQERLSTEMKSKGLTDKQVARMAKDVLFGGAPANEFSASVSGEFMEDEGLDYVAAVRRTQPNYLPSLNGMPTVLPLLLGAWFMSETSRNPLSFHMSLMLLDLMELGVTLPNGVKVNWVGTVFHPDMLDKKGPLSKTDPDRKYCRLGGLHPMSHMGSYNEFKHDKYQREMTLSNIKSVVILILWLKIFVSNKVRIVSKQEYQASEKVSLVAGSVTPPEALARVAAFNSSGDIHDLVYQFELFATVTQEPRDLESDDYDEAVSRLFEKPVNLQPKMPSVYPSLLAKFGVRKNKVTGGRVSLALDRIAEKHGPEVASQAGQHFLFWTKQRNRKFNTVEIKEKIKGFQAGN